MAIPKGPNDNASLMQVLTDDTIEKLKQIMDAA